MKEYRRGSHTKFAIEIHLVWCTKYRKGLLKGDIAYRFRELARESCSKLKVEIIKGVVSKDHVHMLVSIPPQISVSKVMQQIKGKSSYKLQREFKSLHKEYWGQRMWARGYFAWGASRPRLKDKMTDGQRSIKNRIERSLRSRTRKAVV